MVQMSSCPFNSVTIKEEIPDPSSSWRSLIPVIKVNISTVSCYTQYQGIYIFQKNVLGRLQTCSRNKYCFAIKEALFFFWNVVIYQMIVNIEIYTLLSRY